MRRLYPIKKLLLPCMLLGSCQLALGQSFASIVDSPRSGPDVNMRLSSVSIEEPKHPALRTIGHPV